MKFKNLIAKFGYRSLDATCKQKGWRIPTVEEIRENREDSPYNFVWVSDKPPKEEDRETHGLAYDFALDDVKLVNKSFMLHCIVVKESQ